MIFFNQERNDVVLFASAYLEALILRLRPDMFKSSIQGIFAFPAGEDDYVNDEKSNQHRQHPE